LPIFVCAPHNVATPLCHGIKPCLHVCVRARGRGRGENAALCHPAVKRGGGHLSLRLTMSSMCSPIVSDCKPLTNILPMHLSHNNCPSSTAPHRWGELSSVAYLTGFLACGQRLRSAGGTLPRTTHTAFLAPPRAVGERVAPALAARLHKHAKHWLPADGGHNVIRSLPHARPSRAAAGAASPVNMGRAVASGLGVTPGGLPQRATRAMWFAAHACFPPPDDLTHASCCRPGQN